MQHDDSQLPRPYWSDRIGRLSPTKRALLELRLGDGTPAERGDSIPRRPASSPAVLSFAQESLWVLDQLDPGTPAYNIQMALRFKGMLQPRPLERAINEITRRHESLRTTFRAVAGRAVQIVAEPADESLPLVDLGKLTLERKGGEVDRVMRQEVQRRFDLSQGPLFRPVLLQLSETESLLLLTLHHIISDGWSNTVLCRELLVLYEDFCLGRSTSLPELPLAYADYAVWQREQLKGNRLQEQLSYWKTQLTGAPTSLDLPTDYPRLQVQRYRGTRQSILLSAELSESLRLLSQRSGVTFFMTLLAAFKVLLSRYTKQKDILVGTSSAGRNLAEVEGLIGFFVNSLVLRTDTSGNPPFREFLERIRETCLGAYTHQDLPFSLLVEALHPQRHLSRTPLFQVLFGARHFQECFKVPGAEVERMHVADGSRFDLELNVREQRQAQLVLNYNTDLFSGSRARAMLEQMEHLLSQIAVNPEEKIEEYSLVSPAARSVLPDPEAVLGRRWEGAVHTLFSQQARRFPKRLAVVDPTGEWSYEDLDSRSNQLANYLCASGVERGDVVAIYGCRSALLVLGILGILKSGGAFLILDPAYPKARLLEYLRIACPKALVHVESRDMAPADSVEALLEESLVDCHVVLGSTATAENEGGWESYSKADPGLPLGLDDIAYVAFTSGSTGNPKGVWGRHGPVTHFLPWIHATFALTQADRFSVLSGLAFSPFQREIFTPLSLGATMHIPGPEDMDPSRLARWLKQAGITVAHLTPAMGRILYETSRDIVLERLRYVIFAGDVLRRRDVEGLRVLAPQVNVVNFYGATETQRAVGYFQIPTGHSEPLRETIPVGRGIPDVQLVVLSDSKRLAGVSELGEIYFRSPHLAGGYIDDEELARERFIPNPFTDDASDRLYRTFEVGRYLPDGNVELVGRKDDQVNIRGFRIDLGEVEVVLGTHPGVTHAAVQALEDGRGDKRLVAYIVTKGERLRVGEIRRFLARLLPEYMVPTAFVFLDALPLTPNGKVDRGALPPPQTGRPDVEAEFVAPRTSVEVVLAEIWQGLLDVEQVGVYDSFFDLGGHSLLAVQFVNRVIEVLQVEIPLSSLFEAPTIAELSQELLKDPERASLAQGNAELFLQVAGLSDDEVESLLGDDVGQ